MKDAVLIIGRFSGFHRGHVEVIRKAHLDHPDKILIIAVVVGKQSSQDLNKNPFTFEERKEIIEKILNKYKIDASIIKVPTAYIPQLAETLKEEYGINIKYVYCGSDRIDSYLKQGLEKLGIKIIQLEREETSLDPTKKASATKVRNAVKNNDFEAFRELMPDELDEDSLLDIWNTLRNAMKEKGIEVMSNILYAGITHIEDLDVDDFIRWVKNFYNKNIIAIQKLDGTFNMSVFKTEEGIEFSRISKKQFEPFTADTLPKDPIYNALRGAVTALEQPKVVEIFDEYLDEGDSIDIEVLYGDQPNTIRYNLKNNYLALLRFITGKSGGEAEEILDKLTEKLRPLELKINNTVYYYNWDTEQIESKVQEETWKFTKPEILDKLNYEVNFEEDLEALSNWLEKPNEVVPEYTNLEILSIKLNRVKKDQRELLKEARTKAIEEANKLKLNIKNKMIENILKQANFEIGGPNQEGLVLRDLDTGEMTKLVDKDTFTKENKRNWYYIEKAGKGVKIGDEFIPGVTAEFFDFCADTLNIPMLRVYSKLWKNIKDGDYDILTNIKNFIISKDISVEHLDNKLVLIKREAEEAIKKIKELKDEAAEDEQLSDTMKRRTLDSLGLVNNSFKNLVNELNQLISNYNKDDELDMLARTLFVILKNFSY